MNDRADRAYRQRVTQLQERESEYGLQLSQQHAPKRLELRTKLSNLALDDSVRNQYKSQLDELNKSEADAVNAMRARDQQDLATFRKQLQTQTAAQVASESAKIHAQTQAKLQSHRNDVSAQVRSQIGVPQAQASPLSPELRAKLAQIDQQYKSQFQQEAQKTIADYQATKADLDAQYAALQGAGGAATAAGNRQLATLQRQHDDLYNKMVDQIKTEAGTIAAKRGLKVVFMNVTAAPGGYDLTDEVEKDIESLHE
ncbi:MAG: OmpH family outer membrane protein [Candidatus Eremiobacteraeota bacterium]|nr:OmpH family outer membrane protein [Candidatus Eremiobacteraeota bacterium]